MPASRHARGKSVKPMSDNLQAIAMFTNLVYVRPSRSRCGVITLSMVLCTVV